ncbi:hypothetical protein [Streptomyces sp. NPDC058694]|uniref:hypothetical protein n=1 Tax=Streptomyces sp. NPDC058694 TaxID=3346603 RepID=UPI00364F3F88
MTEPTIRAQGSGVLVKPGGRVSGGLVGDQPSLKSELAPAIPARIASASAGGAVVAVEEEAVAPSAGLPESPGPPPEQAPSVSSRAAVDTSARRRASGRWSKVASAA